MAIKIKSRVSKSNRLGLLTKIDLDERTISFFVEYSKTGDLKDPNNWETYSIDDLPVIHSKKAALDPRDDHQPYEVFAGEGNEDTIIIKTK